MVQFRIGLSCEPLYERHTDCVWVEHQAKVHPVFQELVGFIFRSGVHPCRGFAITLCDRSVGVSRCSIDGPHFNLAKGPVSSCVLIHLGR